MATEIDRCLSSAAREERIRRFALLDRQLSMEKGELTAKMSLCREVIQQNFGDQLAALNAACKGDGDKASPGRLGVPADTK